MNILILNASPRKGNTLKALTVVKDNIRDVHHTSMINLYDYPLKPCRNCDACLKQDRGCIYNDGSEDINNSILDADLVIFATPIYYWGMTAQMKLLIDKFYSVNDKLMKKHLKVILITVGASEVSNIQYKLVHEQFKAICEYLHWDLLRSVPISAYAPDDILKQEDTINGLQCLGSSL